MNEEEERRLGKEFYRNNIPKKKPKSYDTVVKALKWLQEHYGGNEFNYFAVQSATGRVANRKLSVEISHWIAFRFLEPEGKIEIITDTKKWNGDRFIYKIIHL